MLTLARLLTVTAASGVRAERASLKTVCRATGGGRRNNSRSPKTKPQNVVPGRASTKGTPVFAPRRGCVSPSVRIFTFPRHRCPPETRRSRCVRTSREPRSDPNASATSSSHRLTVFSNPSLAIQPRSRPVKTPWTRASTPPPLMPRSATHRLPSLRSPRPIPRAPRGRPKSTMTWTRSSRCVSVPDNHP